ncbi:proton channel OtopLc [Aplysia californica]|uniref:Proton channel OtopLc n=1 Tax=Aplysia californica TaxID=6500 RepID=A0ABM0ZYC3_APLCA|nr:proton channel OtopLc [Aplysia californica]
MEISAGRTNRSLLNDAAAVNIDDSESNKHLLLFRSAPSTGDLRALRGNNPFVGANEEEGQKEEYPNSTNFDSVTGHELKEDNSETRAHTCNGFSLTKDSVNNATTACNGLYDVTVAKGNTFDPLLLLTTPPSDTKTFSDSSSDTMNATTMASSLSRNSGGVNLPTPLSISEIASPAATHKNGDVSLRIPLTISETAIPAVPTNGDAALLAPLIVSETAVPAASTKSDTSQPTSISETTTSDTTPTNGSTALPVLETAIPAAPAKLYAIEERKKTSLGSQTSSRSSVNDGSDIDFGILKSAMRESSDQAKRGRRRLSLFSSAMRRVSIHRRESTPTGRIATFFFGADDPESQDESVDEKAPQDTAASLMDKRKEALKKKSQMEQLRESLFLILSGLYGIVIVILGAVIPITEIFISDQIDRAFEAFYVYLYTVSVIFLVYVYAYLLRRNRLKSEFLTRTLSRSMSWTKAWAKSWARADNDVKGKLRKRMISLDVSNHHTGTFYLRLGVLGFGVGSMIHSGLHFGTFFSVSDSSCNDGLQAAKPMLHLAFTFFQLYFIFMNSKVCIHRYKKLARFGLMHMCATNICVWFRSIVVETLHVIHMHEHKGDHAHSVLTHVYSSHDNDLHGTHDVTAGGYGDLHGHDHDLHGHEHDLHLENLTLATATSRKLLASALSVSLDNSSINCQWSEMMGKAVEAAGPYLYPCTIEYSLMCAGILYSMWKNVGKRPRRPRESDTDDEDEESRVHRMSVDCTGSSRGLFLGILLMVGTIISIIAFYMLMNQQELRPSAIMLTHLSETAIYTVTFGALIMATLKMKSLTFHNEHDADLEDILILISYTGLLAFIIFSLVASILHKPDMRSALTILSNVTMLIQATLQTIFMLAGDRMSAANHSQVRKKPGRDIITFLLISNFAMWAINTFETQTPQHNPIQVEFYGPEAWAIFTHISVPLGIYFRFHSTVCFSNIWKNAWKIRKHI